MTSFPVLFNDVTSVVSYFLLLPVILAVLFLLAWGQLKDSKVSLVTPSVFWLLALGGAIGWLGNIPVFYWRGSVIALNVGGGLIPIALSGYFLMKSFGENWAKELTAMIPIWVAGIGVALALEILGARWYIVTLCIAAIPIAVIANCFLRSDSRDILLPPITTSVILAIVMAGTFLTTYVAVGVGIVSPYPAYFVPPVAAGLLAVPFFWKTRELAPPIAYATSTLGTFVGADILNQPGLYGSGSFLGSIGGAGPLDLVYMSGLMSLAIAVTFNIALTLRERSGASSQSAGVPSIGGAINAYNDGRTEEAAKLALGAVRQRAATVSKAFGADPREGDPIRALPMHPLAISDYENLSSAASDVSLDREGAHASIWTGFYLLAALDVALSHRLATMFQRTSAFFIDLGVTVGPAAAVAILWYYRFNPGNLTNALNSIAFESLLFGMAAYPVVVFILMEFSMGQTPGKLLLGLTVVGPEMEKPSMLEAIGRNVTKILSTTALAYTIGLAIPLSFQGGANQVEAIALVLGGLVSVVLTGGIAVIVMGGNRARRRIGDLMVRTQVLTLAGGLQAGQQGQWNPKTFPGRSPS